MTTLHGLVTIYELFAGFHLINMGVVNCLIMCQNVRKMHHSEAKNFCKGGTAPPQLGGGHPSPSSTPFGTQPGPQMKILDPPVYKQTPMNALLP